MAIREEQKQEFDEAQVNNQVRDLDQDQATASQLQSRVLSPIADQSYLDDIGDEIMLTWIGQLLDADERNLGGYSNEFDRNYNPFEAENIEGYEEHAEQFLEVRNKGHHDYLKSRIDVNTL